MASKLSVDAFRKIVAQSGLIPADVLTRLLSEFEQQPGVDVASADALATFLIGKNLLSSWQADKLLQGKHKGFFLGKYRLLSLLGKGGMSSVYLAEHVLMRRRCAIKVLPAKRVHDSSYLGRFHREAQAVASLDHPNIVRAYDVDKEISNETEIHFLVMEHVDGYSLQDKIRKDGVSTFEDAADYIRQSGLGLDHAHRAGMVHRDIKPGNLLVDPNGVVKILDLGLARFFDEEDKESLTVAHDEKVLGTADYLAPEQALDSHKVDSRADIYSLGCTLYFLLTGHPPFVEGTLAQRLMSHQTKEPPPVTNDRPDTPASLEAILKKMMAKNPDDRYRSGQEVADVTSQWLVEHGSAEWKRNHPTSVAGFTGSSTVSTTAAAPPVPAKPQDENLASFLANLDEEKKNSSVIMSGNTLVQKRDATPPRTPAPEADNPPKSKPKQPVRVVRKPQDSGKQPVVPGTPAAKQRGDSAIKPNTPAISDDNPFTDGFPMFNQESAAGTPQVTVQESVSLRTTASPSGSQTKLRTAGQPTTETQPQTETDQQSADAAGAYETHSPEELAARKKLMILSAIGGGLTLMLGIAIYAMFFAGEPEPDEPPQNIPIVETDEDRGILPRQLSVGPKEKYTTIEMAINKVKESFEPNGPDDILTITIQPGTYAESIHVLNSFDVSPGVKIQAGTGGPVILTGSGSGPILKLVAVRSMTIEGLQIQADGKEIAVELGDQCDDLVLQNLQISGFSKSGIDAAGLSSAPGSTTPVRLENVSFRSSGSSTGIAFRTGRFSCARVNVVGCRFQGVNNGIHFADEAENMIVARCIFDTTKVGVQIGDSILSLGNLEVVNCTFRNNERPIHFEEVPGSGPVRFYRNLFLGSKQSELVLARAEATAPLAKLVQSAKNWSDRAAVPAGELEFNLCAHEGKRGDLGLTIASTDPASPDYLKPVGVTFPPKGGGDPGSAQPHIGAVAP